MFARVRPNSPYQLAIAISIVLATTLSICHRGKQPCAGGNGPTEASVIGIPGEKLLAALLAGTPGDVEVGVEQQRVAWRHRVGNDAEDIFAIIALACLEAQELLFDSGGLRATPVGIDGERKAQVQWPLKALQQGTIRISAPIRVDVGL